MGSIEHDKQVHSSITKEFRQLIDLYKLKTDKKLIKILRRSLREREKNCL